MAGSTERNWNKTSPSFPQREFVCGLETAEFQRGTSPYGRTNLLLRIETPNGPRTIVAPGVSLAIAHEIANVLTEAGHFAELVEPGPSVSIAERMRRRPIRLPRAS
jgi:hypothetical protein